MGAPQLALVPSAEAEYSSASPGLSLRYEDQAEFNARFDEDTEPVRLAGVEFSPSEVLFRMDETAYGEALEEWKVQREEELIDLVIAQFPTPIAYAFRRFERGCNSEIERLRCLKDVWEALIFMLYALVMGEVRCAGFPLAAIEMQSNKIKMQDLLSDKINTRLSIIARVLQEAHKPSTPDLDCAAFLSSDLVEELIQLNRHRNGFSHEETESETQARALVAERRPEVVRVLDQVRALADITILLYETVQTVAGEARVRSNIFRGPNFAHDYETIVLEGSALTASFPHFRAARDGGRVLAFLDGRLVSLSPFLHCLEHNDGHEWRLCYYKDKHCEIANDPATRMLDYSVSGLARGHSWPHAEFQTEMDELRALLPAT